MIYNRDIDICRMKTEPRYDIIDSHLHFLDFTQDSDGFPSLVRAMDAAGVSESVVFGMPMAKKWDYLMKERPAYYLSNDSRCYYYSGTDHILANELLSAPEEIRKRFHPFCCGFDCTDKYAATQIERLLKMYPGFWCGIGELMSRHDDLTALTYGEGIHMDSPAFRMIYDLAADHGLPVLVHHNISPQNAIKPLYEEELIRALEHNRKCRIIWAHVGVSRRIELEELLIIAGQLLHDHPNLYVDISWIFFENYIRGEMMHGNYEPEIFTEMWAALIEKYSDRFMIGSDKVGHWETYPDEIGKYYMLLDKLSPETAKKLCRENALSLIRKWD
ncbi:Amidohydrolase [Sarcina sp. DSM 11001]|uniref:amidohydrolase family protein n=1 Tax=Sarcina sp. DSM 11001 TaxID=1798184 RepID=UPI0008871E3F|nr:amidohydrolase family protein [Sarcina sp. DSM 11001]SDL22307.1 Amidohydrolase [Sarcina sp. DSM 11001]